jgi:hypothetical protein
MTKYTFEQWIDFRGSRWHVRVLFDDQTGRMDAFIGPRPGKYPYEYPHFHYFTPDALGKGEIAKWSLGKGPRGHDDYSEIPLWMQEFVSTLLRSLPALRGDDFSVANLQRELDKQGRYSRDLWDEAVEQSKALQELWNAGQISQANHDRVKRDLDGIFAQLNKWRDAFKQESQRQYQALKVEIGRAVQQADSAQDTRSAFDDLKRLQSKVKETQSLGKKERDELFAALQQGFETLKRKREQRAKVQEQAFNGLKSDAERAANAAGNSRGENTQQIRDSLKQIQGRIKDADLTREQRDAVRKIVQQGFDALEHWRKEREGKQMRNNQYLQRRVQECVYEARSTADFQATRTRLMAVSQEVRTEDLKKDDRDYLKRQVNEAFDTLSRRQKEAAEARQKQWREQQHQRIRETRARITQMEDSVRRDEENLSRQHDNYRRVRSGPREHEIKRSIDDRIRDIQQRISSKREKIRGLYDRVREMESKL